MSAGQGQLPSISLPLRALLSFKARALSWLRLMRGLRPDRLRVGLRVRLGARYGAVSPIVYVCLPKFSSTIDSFLDDWGRSLRGVLARVGSDQLDRYDPDLEARLYIFSDLDRLSPPELDRMIAFGQRLSGRPRPPRVFNQPSRVARRLELLHRLHAAGINGYRAWPVDAQLPVAELRFPVFLRDANDHAGPRSGLLSSPEQLSAALAGIKDWRRTRHAPRMPIVVEYLDYRDSQGRFLKYGALRIGDRIVPVHVLHAAHWMVKSFGSDKSAEILELEREYIAGNPHQDELLRICERVGIDFGRIDYTVCDGRIQVFEINTNPSLPKPGASRDPRRTGRKAAFARGVLDALAEYRAPA